MANLQLLMLEQEKRRRQGQTPASEAPASPQTPPESKTKGFIRKVANALPIAGAVGVPTIGAISSGGLSLPASAGLAGIGGAGGTAAKQLILRALGDTEGVPQTSGEAAKEIGIQGVQDAALTYVGGKALGGLGKAAKVVFAPSTKTAGAALGAAENAAKIGVPTVPTDVPLGARQILQFTENNAPYLKTSPKQLAEIADPGFLNSQRKIIKHILDIGKEDFGKATSRIGTQTKAVLAKLDRKFADAIDIVHPEVGKARATSAAAFKKQEVLGTLGKVGKVAAKAGLAGAGLGLASKLIN